MERGELDLDAPVDTYLPEFADVQVLAGFDGDTPPAPAGRESGDGQATGVEDAPTAAPQGAVPPLSSCRGPQLMWVMSLARPA